MLRPRSFKTFASGLVAAGLVVATTMAFAVPANAADGDNLVIRKVDTSDFSTNSMVKLTLLKPNGATSSDDVLISENGSPITKLDNKSAAQASLPMGVAIVIDTSIHASSYLAAEKAAAISMIQNKTPNEEFAVVATSLSARTAAQFTTDSDALISTINGLQASNQGSLWSGVSIGTNLLAGESSVQHNLVLMAGGTDELSPDGAYGTASRALDDTHTVAFVLGFGDNLDKDKLSGLASQTGGRYIQTGDSSSATAIVDGFQNNLANQAVVSFVSNSKTNIDLKVSVANATATAHAAPNTVSEGSNVSPTVVKQVSGPSFLLGPAGVIIMGLLALGAVGGLLYGISELFTKDKGQLSSALRPYSDEPEQRDISRLSDSEIIKKPIDAIAKAAQDRGLLELVEQRLEQADLPFKAAEALTIFIVTGTVAMLVGALVLNLIGIVFAALLFFVLPVWYTGFRAKRRKSKFTKQLPDTLQLMAGSLRAGYSLVQGLDAVSKQTEAPMGPELVRALSEARLGKPVEESLQDISDRMASDDFEWAVMAIKIQREVGGNLAELLMTVSETMIARERLRREVAALTAEGRISAIVLAGLPPIIAVVIAIINPGYMSPMLGNILGQIALGVGALMIVLGYFLMMKMIKVEA